MDFGLVGRGKVSACVFFSDWTLSEIINLAELCEILKFRKDMLAKRGIESFIIIGLY